MEKLASFTESSQDLFYEALTTAPGTLYCARVYTAAHGIESHRNVTDLLATCREKQVNPFLRVSYHFSYWKNIFVPTYYKKPYNEVLPEEATRSGSLDALLDTSKPLEVSVELIHPEVYEGVQGIHQIPHRILQEKFLPFLKAKGYEINMANLNFTEDAETSLKLDIQSGWPESLTVFENGIDPQFKSKVADWLTPLREKYK